MLQPGDPAPDFELADQSGTTRRLGEWKGRWLTVYFYPKDETPGCVAEACSFRDRMERLDAHGISVVGVSKDSVESHRAFAENRGITYPLLADTDGRTVAAYGARGFLGYPKRITFLVDPDGIVRWVHESRLNPKGHAHEVIAAYEKLTGKPASGAPPAQRASE